jgi:uncharacterized protein (DUF1786 family)
VPALLADVAAVGPGVIDRAVLAAVGRGTAVVGEPEAAGLVEDQVVRAYQPLAVAGIVDGRELAALQVEALDHTAGVAGRGWAGDGQAAVV